MGMTTAAGTISSPDIRRLVIECAKRAGVGHIGSALSIVDMLAAVYGDALRAADPADPDRDRFVLSKGHGALALYAALHLRGWLTAAELDSYCRNGTLLGVHPDHRLPGIDFSTGSLGHGLSLGAGAALAARLRGSQARSFVLVSDAECNAGALWEAVMFAAHHRLANLVALVDVNGQQALGYTREVLDLSPMAERWRAFGWRVHDVDGHDRVALAAALTALDTASGAPHVLLCRTTFGKGVSFMEQQIKWHYWPLSDDEYRQALNEIVPSA
jgi:transketolase